MNFWASKIMMIFGLVACLAKALVNLNNNFVSHIIGSTFRKNLGASRPLSFQIKSPPQAFQCKV